MPTDPNPTAVLRCERTGNPVGTDTWAVGHSCPCAVCQRWLDVSWGPTPTAEDRARARRISLPCEYVVDSVGEPECGSEGAETRLCPTCTVRDAIARLLAQVRAEEREGLASVQCPACRLSLNDRWQCATEGIPAGGCGMCTPWHAAIRAARSAS